MTCTNKDGKRRNVQYDQVFCFPDTWFKKKRRVPWNFKSPRKAAMRLDSGLKVLLAPVPYGEPWAGSEE